MREKLLFILTSFLLLAPLGAKAQKTVYIPVSWRYDATTQEYTENGNSDLQWSFNRSKQSDNCIIFWQKGFGSDPTRSDNPFDPDAVLRVAETCYELNVNTLGFTNSNMVNKYKVMILMNYTTTWTCYGGGYDFEVSALWLNPSTVQPAGYSLAHEVGHSFHYMCYAEHSNYNHTSSRTDNTGFHLANGNGQAVWEQTAQWQANQAYPSYMFSESYPLFGNNANYAFSHEWMRYQSYWFFYYLCQYYNDITTVAQVWKQPMTGQTEGKGTDFCQALMALKGLSAEEFFALYFDYALHCTTYDFDAASRYRNSYIGRFDYHGVLIGENKYQVAYSSAPQCSGFNVVELAVPTAGTAITTRFTGLTPGCNLVNGDPATYNNGNANSQVSAGVTKYNAVSDPSARGFRVGYVFLKSDGTRQYYNDGIVHCTGTDVVTEDITATVPSGTSRIFLVITPSLTTYVKHAWDENIKNDDQWPYQFEIVGTTATSVTPHFSEPEFEQQIDGRRIADVTLNYKVVLAPSATAYTGATVTFTGSGLNALCTAFQLSGDDIFNNIVTYSASGPANGKIMNDAANADGTLQGKGKSTNGDFGHWFNASGAAVTYGSGCVAYAEFTKSSKSAVIGQYPNANSNGTQRTIREALRYRNQDGDIATAYLVFNITFETGSKNYAYLTDIDYVEPRTEGITATINQAENICAPTIGVMPGETASYTLTDEEVESMANAFSATTRTLAARNLKGYLSPITDIPTSGIYYYTLKNNPETVSDEEVRITYYNVPSVQTDTDFADLYTYYYDTAGMPLAAADAGTAAFKVAFDMDSRTFSVKVADDCPIADYSIIPCFAKKRSVQFQPRISVAYFPITVAVSTIPTYISNITTEQSIIDIYDLSGRKVSKSTSLKGLFIIDGKKVLIK